MLRAAPVLTRALAAQTDAQKASSCDPQLEGSCTLGGHQEAQWACTTHDTAAHVLAAPLPLHNRCQ